MRIATWNINGLRARLDFIKLWLDARQPNVVGFQELKTPTEDCPHEFFAELGYQALVYGQKSWNGVAILTNVDAEHRHSGLPGEEDWGSRLITAEIDGGLEFTTVYCPNGKSVDHDDYPNKLRWYDSLLSHWQQSDHPQRILCGDGSGNLHPKLGLSHANKITVREHLGASQSFPVDVRSIGASQVGDEPSASLHDDLGMVARNLAVGQNDLVVPVPADAGRLESKGEYVLGALLHELTDVHSLSPRPVLADVVRPPERGRSIPYPSGAAKSGTQMQNPVGWNESVLPGRARQPNATFPAIGRIDSDRSWCGPS